MYNSFSARSFEVICEHMNENNVKRDNIIAVTDSDGWISIMYWKDKPFDDYDE